MYVFILESIGTSELILIGIVALIFLGPRKLPEIARKIGKITSEFRGTANEFKQTWQREVDFEEESKLLNLNEIEAEAAVPRNASTSPVPSGDRQQPAVKEIDPAEFERLAGLPVEEIPDQAEPTPATTILPADDKRNWL